MAAPPSSRGGGTDRLSALPDEILQQIISFLPSQEAVRTCVLARTWRDLWKLTHRLRITGTAASSSVHEVLRFVDPLLLLRLRGLARAPIDACDITFQEFSDEDLPHVNRWISLAVACRVQELRLDIYREEHDDSWFRVHDEPLVSSHLTRLELKGIEFSRKFADFSSCHALRDLVIVRSDYTGARKMKFPSVERLTVKDCISCQRTRTRIWAPRLVSLWVENPSPDRTPVLEGMPELVVAYVKTGWNLDFCYCDDDDRMDCDHVMGDGSYSESDDKAEEGYDDVNYTAILLGGLSEAVNLTLISDYSTFIFRRDLRWCPTFSKLKILLLNDYWCQGADCRALSCILQHAPVLEKLTILFPCEGPRYKVEMKGCLDASERSAVISEHLKIVEVKCEVLNERFFNVLKYLVSLNIYFSSEK